MKKFRVLVASAMLALSPAAWAAEPQPPCAMSPNPAFPQADAAPVFSLWKESELDQSKWQPPACTGWANPSRSRLVVALAGSFHFGGTMDTLLERLGATSDMPAVKYWSTTDTKWRPLANEASALNGPDAKTRRADFSATEFSKGATLHYWMDDTRFGEVVYRANIIESTPDRAVVTTMNTTKIRQFLITIFEPGALQSVVFLQRLSPGVFGVYILTRNGEGASALANWHDTSYVNRSVALYRYLAGIKTDQEPPAAR